MLDSLRSWVCVQRTDSTELIGGAWQEEEARRFFHAYKLHGQNWDLVSS